MPIRMVVTGKSGQVVSSILERAAGLEDFDVITAGRPELDLADPASVAQTIKALEPHIVVNAAAYTAVDKAEEEPELAHAINGIAAGEVARGAALAGVPVIHISTDYVFDGEMRRSYREDDPVAPLGVYGRSKLEGERLVAAANPDHYIFRTAWVYSPFGHNFVKTMLRLSQSRDTLNVVDDQLGNPTSALDIADGIIAAARRIADPSRETPSGVYNLAGTGTASWCEMARAVFAVASGRGGRSPLVHGITTAEYPTPAARPASSRLDCAKFEMVFGYRAPPWRDSLAECVKRLNLV
jgi:dTDP-4-dehydrorhamnose reductase